MPKYKYVDGVKYRVVPQSVLGYALVREDSDNSLPTGGTEGQVLSKASNADYDVEWTTVESGGDCVHFIFDTVEGNEANTLVLADETKAGEYFNNIKNGKLPVLCVTVGSGSNVTKLYASDLSMIVSEANAESELFEISLAMTTVTSHGVTQRNVDVSLGKILATNTYGCEITITDVSYPGVG